MTGLVAGGEATASIGTTRTDYVPGTGSKTARALDPPRIPTFGAVTRTPDGFRVSLTNYSADYVWAGTATASGRVAISGAGVITVSGLVPDTASTLTVTTRRSGYADGQSTAVGRSLKAALLPQFGATVQTPDGYTTTVVNYDGNFAWTLTATGEPDEITIDDSGFVTISGLSPGTPCRLHIVTTRAEHADGAADLDAQSQAGPALTPQFGGVGSTASGFTTQIVNFRADFAWSASTTAGQASIDPSGFVTVGGLAPGQASMVTIEVARTGYSTGSAAVIGSALAPIPSVPPPPTAPAAPILVKLKALATDKLRLDWKATATGGAPIQKAIVMCQPADGGPLRIVQNAATSITIGKLQRDTRYRCTVAVRNQVGMSLQSKALTTATLAVDKIKKPKPPKKPKRPKGHSAKNGGAK